ncbi:MAG: DUF3857 and transglutaminase domain-containing protein [Chitinophagaceae bacterium]|nr:DUF3857 and transglutaminase domain-containing protein [Chitinophagaceae bacterium]
MYKALNTLFLFIFCTNTLFAQQTLPAFGKIDKADLLLTNCPFDKEADAMKLIDYCSMHYDRGGSVDHPFKTVYQYRVRLKILKTDGLEYANITLPFYSYNNEEKITKIEGYSYSLNDEGKIIREAVNKKAIYTQKINSSHSKKIMVFPNVKVGSVIEYRYVLESDDMSSIKDWIFQDHIPAQYSAYEINVPQIFRYSILPTVVDSMYTTENVKAEIIATNKGVVNTTILQKTFSMQNVKALKLEPFMCSVKDYEQRLQFQLTQIDYGDGVISNLLLSWKEIAQNLQEDKGFGMQLKTDLPNSGILLGQIKPTLSESEKISFLLTYFQKNFSWNGEESIFTLNGIRKTFETKYGNSSDINLLFIKLLNIAGIKAVPIIVNPKINGRINKQLPYLKQFSMAMAYVTLNKINYIIDATDKFQEYKIIPLKITNTTGFIVKEDDIEWIEIEDKINKYKILLTVNGRIDSAGILEGENLTSNIGYARQKFLNDELNNSISEGAFLNDFKIAATTLYNRDKNELPIEVKTTFSYKLNSSDRFKYFTLNLFHDFNKNLFTQLERQTDIDFNYLQEYVLFGNITLPPEFNFEYLPDNVSLSMPDNSIVFNRFVQAEDNILNIRIIVDFKKTLYPVADYPEFKEFYKKLFEKLNEQIVIKKR